MRQTEDNGDGQHGCVRAYLFDEDLKRIAAKHHFFARCRDEYGDKVEGQADPLKIGVGFRNQMAGPSKDGRQQHERRGSSAINEAGKEVTQGEAIRLQTNVSEGATIKDAKGEQIGQQAAGAEPYGPRHKQPECPKQQRRDDLHSNEYHEDEEGDSQDQSLGVHAP